ncbi:MULTISPECIES: efflux RND transporter periplasmic adaptor subunit [Stenotrophomonas]|uniref:Efflux RND transporter periplasmic adaptor subunit n=1 Tax=Stenotrophomonas pavanii TaxID=487698 RepID=A0ABM7R679_9GAMM|nr:MULTISPECIES: efflux RND transporter periplasmic adaptor subunit [Stenotrophomonas]MBH1388972.1 efflux RND transporter periplasmic adaptor subunit [Stenotrophomonas maltophilia]MBH1521340.1 efflux RND transporter periplasmic adaptor subunit [Stenotrophomonas maltophilia]MCF3463629.1 efflux RND transporter periplasmic adaptor subunit [Stenotrophomonas maltophilia]MCF3484884.1 efflux RND transporter periplasmic adaptor subunit [Stenotrophomonas maltophilia]MCF3508146.1 efflux RND transporter 
MTLSRTFPLIGGVLLAVLLAGCAGNAQTPANEDPAAAKAGTDDGHGHASDSKEAKAESAKAPADADEGVVQLTPEQIKASGIEVVAVGRGGGGSTRLSGRVEPSVGARASVASTVTGRVERVLVAPGTAVKQNQALAIVVSGEAAVFRANALAASAEAEAARLAYGRDKALVDQGVVARQEMEASRARSLAAQAQAAAAQAQAAANGSPDSSGRVRITSPVAGIVGNVQVTPGGVVAAGSAVADVADPTMNELVFTAPPALAAQVTPGMTLEVSAPGGSFTATVTGSAADVRQQGGVAVIRATPVDAALPPAGSPVSAVVVTEGQDGSLSVPADAVQNVDGSSAVFVAVEGGFKAQPVLAGRRAGDRIEILGGLTGSERIVGANAFLLKAELAKGEAEHGH